jgi:hypothetical protein
MSSIKRTIGRLAAVAAVALLLSGIGAEGTEAKRGRGNTVVITQTGGGTNTDVVTQTGTSSGNGG